MKRTRTTIRSCRDRVLHPPPLHGQCGSIESTTTVSCCRPLPCCCCCVCRL